jgi:hypothetical protein
MKIYLVKRYGMCDNDDCSHCGDAYILAVFCNRERANDYAKKHFNAFVDEGDTLDEPE